MESGTAVGRNKHYFDIYRRKYDPDENSEVELIMELNTGQIPQVLFRAVSDGRYMVTWSQAFNDLFELVEMGWGRADEPLPVGYGEFIGGQWRILETERLEKYKILGGTAGVPLYTEDEIKWAVFRATQSS